MINGLQNLVDQAGTLHGITGPPERLPVETDGEYEARYVEWQQGVTFWHTEVKEVEDAWGRFDG